MVEDNPKEAGLLRLYLEDAGYRVIKAADGQKALDAMLKNKPDLITLDLMMPEMNGFEVLDRLGSNEATRGIPVVVLTAKILTADERNMLSSKVRMIAEKGRFHKDIFLKEVRSLISRGGETI